jgi:flagellar hook-basal body complex protein FliE
VRGAIQPDGKVAKSSEYLKVTARSATKIENRERRLAFDMTQERSDVLTDVVIAGAIAKVLGVLVIMLQRK